MARSVRQTATVLLVSTIGAGALAGCESTFDQNARAKLTAQRDLGTRTATEVTERTGDVRVDDVQIIRDTASTAVVVDLRSKADRILTDLPITVGVIRDGKKIVLNRSGDIEWFGKHVPAIAPGGTVTWVFRSPPGRGGKRGDEPFVRVGEPAALAAKDLTELPAVRATYAPSAEAPLPTTPGEPREPERPPAPGFARVQVVSGTDVPQLRLPVYAVVRVGNRVTGAGVALLEELPKNTTTSIDISLTRADDAGTVSGFTTPTIFR